MKETTWHMKQGGAQTLFQNYQGRVDFYYADLIKNLKYMTDNQQLSISFSNSKFDISSIPATRDPLKALISVGFSFFC